MRSDSPWAFSSAISPRSFSAGVLGGLCYLCLERRDLLVALGDGLLPVDAAHLRLVFLRLLAPVVLRGLRDFLRLVAMVITGHVSHLSVMADTNKSAL